MRVSIVMPPVADGAPAEVVAGWPSVTLAASALLATGEVAPVVHCRHHSSNSVVEHDGVEYRFHTSDRALVRDVRDARPDVVHVHGLGWSRLILRLSRVGAPIVLQHHGEPPFTGRTRLAHRFVRRWVAAYLFTGAHHGQAQPWIDRSVIAPHARLFEVLEAAALWVPSSEPAVVLQGAPAVLWVGRLIDGKDPITALEAVAVAARRLPDVHLHLLATDRAMEPAVRARIDADPHLRGRVHLHDPVPGNEIDRWYRGASIYLSTSRREGSGYSLIEALTCGCAPVVTAIPPHLAIIELASSASDGADRAVGATFAIGDADGAADAMVQVAAHIRGSREPNGHGSRSLLHWHQVAHQLVAAYRGVTPRVGS